MDRIQIQTGFFGNECLKQICEVERCCSLPDHPEGDVWFYGCSRGRGQYFLTTVQLNPGNVVQFVDFGSKLVSEERDIYHSISGNSTRNARLLESASSFWRMSERFTELAASTGPFRSKDQEDLAHFAEICKKTVEELIRILESLTVNSSNKIWKSIHHASKSTAKKGKIDELCARIDSLQTAMALRLLQMFRYA
jgi:hypothetical protein